MPARKPSMIGVMIRDVLRRHQPQHIAAIGREVNKLRKEEGMRRVTYKYINRLVHEAKMQGLIEEVEEVQKAEKYRVPGHPELDYMVMLKIKRGATHDERWEQLPRLARWKYEKDMSPPPGYWRRFSP